MRDIIKRRAFPRLVADFLLKMMVLLIGYRAFNVQGRIVDDQLVVYSADGGVAVVDVDDGLVCHQFSV